MKTCRDCGQILPLTDFYSNGKSGTMARCKTCNKAKSVAWAKDNKERTSQINMRHREKHLDRKRERGRQWYAAHREEIAPVARERASAWREGNREAHRSYSRQYRRDHPEESRTRSQAWADQNREQINAGVRTRRQSPAVKIKRREEANRRRAMVRAATVAPVDYQAILDRDGYVCHICRLPVKPSDLNFDHVYPLALGGAHSTENIAVSHADCNRRKADIPLAEYLKRRERAPVKPA